MQVGNCNLSHDLDLDASTVSQPMSNTTSNVQRVDLSSPPNSENELKENLRPIEISSIDLDEPCTSSKTHMVSPIEISLINLDEPCSSRKAPANAAHEARMIEHSSVDSKCNPDNIKILVYGTNNDIKRQWDKDDVCPYCRTRMRATSLVQHLIRKHGDVKDVRNATILPKNSAERFRKLQLIRNYGNFLHNLNSLKYGGDIIPAQRPSKTIDITNDLKSYVSCGSCLGFYASTRFSQHRCPLTNTKVKQNVPSLVVSKQHGVKDFFRRLQYDEVGYFVASDEAIVQYVTSEIMSKGVRQFSTISGNARLLAELVLNIRKRHSKHSNMGLRKLVTPQNFEVLYEGLIDMFKYDTLGKAPSMLRPSSMRRLIQTLTKVNEVLRIEYLTSMSSTQAEQQLHLREIFVQKLQPLSYNAIKSLKSASSGLPQVLPSKEDMSTLTNHLITELKNISLVPKNERRVAELTVARLLHFNKRRASEVPKLKKWHWMERGKWKEETMNDHLEDDEKQLVSNMELVFVEGKGGKFVPVIFPEECVLTTEWLSKNKESSDYLFANKNKLPLRGSEIIRKISAELSLRNCGTTKFRKYMATSLQTEGFTDSECQWICEHMGHTLQVHKRYYRLRDASVSLAKVGKLLTVNETIE